MNAELAAFIAARLTAAEEHARKDLHLIDRATPLDLWTVDYGYNLPYSLLGEDGSIGRITSSYGGPLADGEPDQHQADAMLVGRLVRRARRDAEHTLRDVEAKRRLLAMYEEARVYYDTHRSAPAGELYGLWQALQLLAEAWSDHPDFRPEWTP